MTTVPTNQTTRPFPAKSKKELRGFALPFALIVMALIMTSAVTFLISSTNDKAVANALVNDGVARTLGESAIYRAKTVMGLSLAYQFGNISHINKLSNVPWCASRHSEMLRSPFYSMTTNNEKKYVCGITDLSDEKNEKLREGLNKFLFFGPEDVTKPQQELWNRLWTGNLVSNSGYNYTYNVGPQWNYITSPYSVDILDKKDNVPSIYKQRLIGRFAYVGFMGGKISIPYMLSDEFLDHTAQVRKGINPNELRAQYAFNDELLGSQKITDPTQTLTLINNLTPAGKKYLSTGDGGLNYFPDIFTFTRIAMNSGAPFQLSTALPLSNIFSITDNETYELWRMTNHKNGSRPYCHRFNLNRTKDEWNTFFRRLQDATKSASDNANWTFDQYPILLRTGNVLSDHNNKNLNNNPGQTMTTTDGTTNKNSSPNRQGLYYFVNPQDYMPMVDGKPYSNAVIESANIRKTLYANLKDYLDDDYETTHYPTNLDQDIEWAGLEKAPLINRVYFSASITRDDGENAAEEPFVFRMGEIFVDFVDMFNCDMEKTYTVKLNLKATLTGPHIPGGSKEITITPSDQPSPAIECDHRGDLASKKIWAPYGPCYVEMAGTIIEIPGYKVIYPIAESKLKNTIEWDADEINVGDWYKLTFQHVRVEIVDKATGKVVQVAQPVSNKTIESQRVFDFQIREVTAIDPGGPEPHYAVVFEATDPRCRFTPDGWNLWYGNNQGDFYYNRLFDDNGNVQLKPNFCLERPFPKYSCPKSSKDFRIDKGEDFLNLTQDPEPGITNPWEISTAYIRNGLMESPVELGYLHRMRPWQTINLKSMPEGIQTKPNPFAEKIAKIANPPYINERVQEYESTELAGRGITVIDMSEEGYGRGDAGILDQIKWGKATKSKGKINYNIASEGVARALLTDIIIPQKGNTPDNWEEGYTLTPEAVTHMLPNILHATSNRRFFRGSFANAIRRAFYGYDRKTNEYNVLTSFKDGITGAPTKWNDAQQEAIMGKIATILEPEGGRDAMVVVVAQAISDAPDETGAYGTYGAEDSIVGQIRMMAQFVFQQSIYGSPASAENAQRNVFARTSWMGCDWILKRIIYLDPSL